MVVHTIVLAFAGRPGRPMVLAGGASISRKHASVYRRLCGRRIQGRQRVYDRRVRGAALWLPPDLHPDDNAVGDIVDQTVARSLRSDLQTLMGKMAASHPDGPHWYLPMIGVDPAYQNKGLGAALLRHALERCDREGLPAYLESTNPRNISLYLRHGFVAVGEIQAGSSPTVVPMLRLPR